ncbi:IclR family transcriptional regulator [Arthrobacter sedimenti]|uniref:IclR family transcriptional regulator n=1 Tax=Arthrobacter sedimenti TaxID=2694931 RepID=UPI000B355BEC|nr:IclR family transcriptional regulator [Arthrobacter sedimenti]OUM41726.1 IclR family transcriptional regulator [Arthrobacter agilis]
MPDRPATEPVQEIHAQHGQPVLMRALSLLAGFSDKRRSLSLVELSRAAGMPPATALRFLRHFTEWGALERLEDGRYVIGVRLWEIASLAPRGHGIRDIALPYLEDLYEITHQHVLLAVRDGRDAVLIDRLSSKDATEVAYRVGGRLPLPTTAVGRILLAHGSPSLQDEVLASPIDAVPGTAPVSARELRMVLADVRRAGVSTVHRSLPSKTVSVAAPVLGPGAEVVAALSIVMPDKGILEHEVIPAVRTAARAISRDLGYQPATSAAVRHLREAHP